jgi:hypothetical protein
MKVFTYLGVAVCLVLAIALVFWMSGLGAGTVANSTVDGVSAEVGKNDEGEYLSNPFEKPESGKLPKLEVAANEFDFGTMKWPLVDRDGDKQPDGDSHTFVVRNVGEGVLKLARGPSTCQCTMSDLADRVEVPPGGETEITVTWKPDFATDEFSKAATVWTNDPALFAESSEFKDGKIQFTVKGKVVQAVEVDPEYFTLGTLDEKQPTTFSTEVYSRINPDLEVSLQESSSPFITIEATPLDPERMKERKAVAGWKVTGRIEPKLPIGRIRETVTLATNDESRPTIPLTVEATRRGPMSIAGRFWNPGYTMVDFGRFSADKGIETTLSLYAPREEVPLEVSVAEVRPEGLVVTTERDAAYADPERERFLVTVKVPAGRAPERLVGRDAGLVRLKTNREDVPEVKFHVAIESR